MAALGLPLSPEADYNTAPPQLVQYTEPMALQDAVLYQQAVYPVSYQSEQRLPDYLNPAPAGALQWEMPQVSPFQQQLQNPAAPQPCAHVLQCTFLFLNPEKSPCQTELPPLLCHSQ